MPPCVATCTKVCVAGMIIAWRACASAGPAGTPTHVANIIRSSSYEPDQVAIMARRVRRAILRHSAVDADRRFDALLRKAGLCAVRCLCAFKTVVLCLCAE